MRTIRTTRMLGGVLASVLLVAACGDDSDDSDTASEGDDAAAASGEAAAFCDEAATLQSAMLSAISPSDDGAAGREEDPTDYAATLRDIDPPADIAEDWEVSIPVLADFMEAGAAAGPYLEEAEGFDPTLGPEALEDAGVTDPEAVEAIGALTEAQAAFADAEVQTAGGRVGTYIQEQCGEGES